MDTILHTYTKQVKKEWKIAFWVAFVGCILVHIYKFTNFLPNHDSLFSYYSNLDSTPSGRWFLQIAGLFSSNFDLPWVNGLLSAIYLGLTAVLVIELLDIRGTVMILLTSALLIASPCTTETFFYEFTADAFFLGLLLATFGCYLCVTGNKANWKKLILGCICICLSCGIYQAYISFAVLLFLCRLVIRLLNNEVSVKAGWLEIGKIAILFGIALAAYYGIWKLILIVTNQSASSYQGIDTVGQLNASTIVNGAVSSVVNLLRWFFGGNILQNAPTLYTILHYIIFLALVVILIYSLFKSKCIKSAGKVILVLVCMIGCIPVISMWNFVTDGLLYRPMMMHSVMVLIILAMILFNRWAKPKFSMAFAAILMLAILNYGLLANVAYVEMDLTSKRSQATATELMQTIHANDDIRGIAFIGSRQDNLGLVGYPLTNTLESDLLYDHTHAYLYLTQYMGLDIPSATNEEIEQLSMHPFVQALPAWPSSENSIVIDGILVIKLAD